MVPARSWVEISRRKLIGNFQSVRRAVGGQVEIAAVVKADAYGHGAVEVARTLEAAGARWFAVSSADEGVTLREAGIQGRILVMAGVLPVEEETLAPYRLTPVLHSIDDITRIDRLAAGSQVPLAFHLKLDTGMNRLGAGALPTVLLDALGALRVARLEGLMTHFASAADYASLQTDHQVEAFHSVLRALQANGFPVPLRHLASTNAIAYGRREAWHTMVRPGHALYGYLSAARGEAPPPIFQVSPVLTWRARVIQVKDVPEGSLIGYGGSFRAPRPMRIAVLAAGYADGVPHRLSNKGRVIVGCRLVPIIGTVSMDLTTIDITKCPAVRPGDAVTLLGSEGDIQLDAQQIARLAGTISYNVLCGIRSRVRRVYLDDIPDNGLG
ncbi:MAG: alanine racemase [Bryobacteraceae bacterium]